MLREGEKGVVIGNLIVTEKRTVREISTTSGEIEKVLPCYNVNSGEKAKGAKLTESVKTANLQWRRWSMVARKPLNPSRHLVKRNGEKVDARVDGQAVRGGGGNFPLKVFEVGLSNTKEGSRARGKEESFDYVGRLTGRGKVWGKEDHQVRRENANREGKKGKGGKGLTPGGIHWEDKGFGGTWFVEFCLM